MAQDLQSKIMEAFIGKVVRKDLAFLVKGNLPVPTYVLEYLLGQYCATDDEEVIAQGLEKVKDVIRNNYINRAESEEVKGKIRENGRFRIIDKVTAVLNDKNVLVVEWSHGFGINFDVRTLARKHIVVHLVWGSQSIGVQ